MSIGRYGKPNGKFSILINTIDTRQHFLDKIMNIFKPQLTDDVEILVNNTLHANKGGPSIGVKRQQLLDESTGDYIAYVDDDDTISDNYVDLILNAIKTEPDVVGMHLLHYDNGNHTGMTYHSLKYDSWQNLQHPDIPNMALYLRYPNHLNPVKRELALKVGFVDSNFGEDRDYSERLQQYLETEEYIEEPIYTYLYVSAKGE